MSVRGGSNVNLAKPSPIGATVPAAGTFTDLMAKNVLWCAQAAPVAVNATATLTIAQLLAGLITTNSAVAVALTLPTGNNCDVGALGGALPVDTGWDWALINTGSASGLITMSGGTGHSLVGLPTIAITSQAMFRTRKTATNTFVTYRIA